MVTHTTVHILKTITKNLRNILIPSRKDQNQTTHKSSTYLRLYIVNEKDIDDSMTRVYHGVKCCTI